MASRLGKWANPPLAYVVAELRFSPYYSLENLIPALQESLYDEYPRTLEAEQISIANGAQSSQKVPQFLSRDKARGVLVTQKALSLHATQYEDSETFRQSWISVVKAVSDAGLEPFLERAGVRYIDLIVPADDRTFASYMNSALQGLQVFDGATIEQNIWVSRFREEGTTISVRTAAPAPSGMLFPPGFLQLPLSPAEVAQRAQAKQNLGELTGFIDSDCSRDLGFDFDLGEIEEVFKHLHGQSSKIFRSVISESALKEWK